MQPRCVNELRAGCVVAAALALIACGSTPMPQSSPPERIVAAPEPAAAQTFPLDEVRSAESARTATAPTEAANASTTSASTAKAATSAVASPVAEPPLPPEAVQQFDNAVSMAASGNSAAAEQAFHSLSIAYPSYSGPLLNLGVLQSKAGRLEEAEKALKGALERKADNAIALNQLGVVYRRQGRFNEADAAYTRAVQIDPNYANAYLNLGVLCDLYLQQPQRALEAFERYLSLSTAPDERVGAWVKELKVRLESSQRATGAGA